MEVYIFFSGSGYLVLTGTHSHFCLHCLGDACGGSGFTLHQQSPGTHNRSWGCGSIQKVHFAPTQWGAACEPAGSNSQIPTLKMMEPGTWRLVKNWPEWWQPWIPGLVSTCLLKVTSYNISSCWFNFSTNGRRFSLLYSYCMFLSIWSQFHLILFVSVKPHKSFTQSGLLENRKV